MKSSSSLWLLRTEPWNVKPESRHQITRRCKPTALHAAAELDR